MRVISLLVVASLMILGCGQDDETSGGGGSPSSSGGAGADGGTGGSGGSGGSGGAAGGGGSADEIGPDGPSCAVPAPAPDPVCEATSGAACYYVNASSGDDTNGDGSYASPWRSLLNVVSYYGTPGELGSTAKPSTAIDLQPGDHVYLFDGVYSDTYNYQGDVLVARFRGLHGSDGARFHLEAYPGQKPVIDPGGSNPGIHLLQSSFWEISGIEIRNAYGRGLVVAESDQVVLSHLWIHDTDGVDNNNIAGLELLGSSDVELRCSLLHDNYDRTNADTNGMATENSSNIVAFGGGDIRIHHSRVFQTPAPTADKTGGCIKYKHAATLVDGAFEVDHNQISSCRFFAVGTGTQHSHIHHNLISNGAGIISRDFGGTTHQTDQRFDHNTLYNAAGFGLSPSDDWVNADFDDPQAIAFEQNIVVYDLPQPSQENGLVVIGTYASDALYQKTLPELTFTSNCYFNPSGPASFSLFAANGGNYGSLGDQYDLAGWQGLGFDQDSLVGDPLLLDPDGGDLRPAADSPCAAMGAYAD